MPLLLQQLKNRRLQLGFKQHDMMLRVGISRQQYQRLESKGNPRLETLELVAKGLNSTLMLIPQDKLGAVLSVLDGSATVSQTPAALPESVSQTESEQKSIADDPWRDLLKDDS